MKNRNPWLSTLTILTLSVLSVATTAFSTGTQERSGTPSYGSRPGASGGSTSGRPGMHGGGMVMSMTPEARREMSQMMREMADCLDEGTDWVECHQRVHQGRRFRISVEPEGRTSENQRPGTSGREGSKRTNELRNNPSPQYRDSERR